MADGNRCDKKSGMFGGRCNLDGLHVEDHDNGTKKWPRGQTELEILGITLQILEDRRRERAVRAELLDKHRRGEM